MSWSDRADGRRTHFDYEIYLKDCMTMWGKGLFLLIFLKDIIVFYCTANIIHMYINSRQIQKVYKR